MIVLRKVIPFVLLALLAGCAEPPPLRIFWPPPPGELALEFIGAYYSQNSFEKTPFEKFSNSFFGPPRPELFLRPAGVAADGKGVVYVSDNLLRGVRVYDFNRRKVRMLTREPLFSFPIGLDLDSAGRLYVADAGQKRILVLGADGVLQNTFGDESLFNRPAYVKVNERLGRIYVSDGEKGRIVVFDKDGKYLFTFGELGDREGQLFGPQGMAIAADDRVFVASQFTAKIVVFDADGKYLYSFGERGDIAGMMEMPKALAFDSAGRLYVADARKGSLTIMSDKGEPILFVGGGKSRWQPTTFGQPTGIFIDGNDRIYVADSLNRCFEVWQYMTEQYRAEHPVSEAELQRLQQSLRRPAAKP